MRHTTMTCCSFSAEISDPICFLPVFAKKIVLGYFKEIFGWRFWKPRNTPVVSFLNPWEMIFLFANCNMSVFINLIVNPNNLDFNGIIYSDSSFFVCSSKKIRKNSGCNSGRVEIFYRILEAIAKKVNKAPFSWRRGFVVLWPLGQSCLHIIKTL